MQISSQWRHNVHKGKQLKTSLSYLGQNAYFLAIWGPQVGGGGIQWLDSAYLGLKLSSHPYLYVHVK